MGGSMTHLHRLLLSVSFRPYFLFQQITICIISSSPSSFPCLHLHCRCLPDRSRCSSTTVVDLIHGPHLSCIWSAILIVLDKTLRLLVNSFYWSKVPPPFYSLCKVQMWLCCAISAWALLHQYPGWWGNSDKRAYFNQSGRVIEWFRETYLISK